MKNCVINIYQLFARPALIGMALLAISNTSMAWGPEGHSAIGILALNQLEAEVRTELETIVGPLDEQSMVEACNWPDDVRESEQWAWTAPQHYINIPRGDFEYLQSRDCPDQQCATEAIKDYAKELSDELASKTSRRQAFAWLCHLVGDLHQPMHAGFADDRGGNSVEVIFREETMNLHGFWDHELIYQFAGKSQDLVRLLGTDPVRAAGSDWNPKMVDDWTNESHQIAKHAAYPATSTINEEFAQGSWMLAQMRISLAAYRLAQIFNTVLTDAD